MNTTGHEQGQSLATVILSAAKDPSSRRESVPPLGSFARLRMTVAWGWVFLRVKDASIFASVCAEDVKKSGPGLPGRVKGRVKIVSGYCQIEFR